MNKRVSVTAFDKFVESCGQPKQKKTSIKESKPTVKVQTREFPFKNLDFQHSTSLKANKKKAGKSLRQVASAEMNRSNNPDAPMYLSIESPPCLKPPKKYSDISGQLAKYTDPETGLHFATAQEYKQIKRLPNDVVNGYLNLRNASRT